MSDWHDEQSKESQLREEECAFKDTFESPLYHGFKRDDNGLVFPLVYLIEYDQTKQFLEIPWSEIEERCKKIGVL